MMQYYLYAIELLVATVGRLSAVAQKVVNQTLTLVITNYVRLTITSLEVILSKEVEERYIIEILIRAYLVLLEASLIFSYTFLVYKFEGSSLLRFLTVIEGNDYSSPPLKQLAKKEIRNFLRRLVSLSNELIYRLYNE